MLTRELMLESYKYVVENASFVSIDETALDSYVHNFTPTKTHWSASCPFTYTPRKAFEEEIDFLFLIGNQAFCYWGQPKWHMDFRGQKYDGWWAAIAVFEKALENNIPILEGKYLANLTIDQARKLFEGEPEIPLLEERCRMLKQIGITLVEKYDGRFHKYFQQAPKDAISLTVDIAETFSGFDDTPTYKDKPIYFYKKAQLVVNDIYHNVLKHDSGIINISHLTGCADYKVPAIMRQLGLLVYTPELANKIDNRVHISKESEEEIEIRASQLWIGHLVREKLKNKYPDLLATHVADTLWSATQSSGSLAKPYHLTPTIYY